MRPSLTEAENINEILNYILVDGRGFTGSSMLTPEEVKHIINLAGGFWQQNGDRHAPHVVLTSGKHSDGYINLPAALGYVAINDLFAESLGHRIRQGYPDLYRNQIDWVVGSDHSAITFSYAVAQWLKNKWPWPNHGIKHGSSEKKRSADGKEIHKWGRHVIGEHERVLNVEELSRTFQTLKLVREGIANAHPDYPILYMSIIAMAVNSTGVSEFEGSPIISLFDIKFNEYDVKNGKRCLLCEGGSEPLKNVKSAATWAKLNCR